MEKIKIGIAGFGTVGSGLAKIMVKNAQWIEKRIGKSLEIKSALVRDLKKSRAFDPGPGVQFTDNPADLINDPEIDIVVELMGGVDAPKKLIEDAIEAGKHVVTANKHLLAEHGLELFAKAAEKGVGLFYEASVAGGIPIIKTLSDSLAGDRVESLLGILNGTANYILSEMTTKGIDFQTALEQAQDLGYAEADPTLDIEGFDTAHKLCVIIRLAFGVDYPLEQLPIQGITGVTPMDIDFARDFGYRIKLLAHAREVDGKIEAGVNPALVPYTYLLARVGGNYNAVRVVGEAVGPVMLHGQGAGDLPTGNAVLADILDLARGSFVHTDSQGPDNNGFGNAPIGRAQMLPPEQSRSKYYFRFTVADRPGVMAAIAQAMADHDISIAQAQQKGDDKASGIPVVFITHDATAESVQRTIDELDNRDFTMEPCVCFRIL